MMAQFDDAGLRPTESYNVMVNMAGGEEYVGHTKRDQINWIKKYRTEKILKGDAQTVFNKLHQLKEEDPRFYFSFRYGEDARLEDIYWRDPMMKEDFDLFGDVIIFDTSYNTNRYNLICAPIVEVNNHWNTVMYGCAFLSSETSDTFEWVLGEFKKSMGDKEPITIFTDPD